MQTDMLEQTDLSLCFHHIRSIVISPWKNIPCISEALPGGYLFPCSPEKKISIFPLFPKIKILIFYVPCFPKLPCSPVTFSFRLFPLLLWNKWPYSPVPQNPWEGLISVIAPDKASFQLKSTCINFFLISPWHVLGTQQKYLTPIQPKCTDTFLISAWKCMFIGTALEAPWWGTSSEYPHHIFSWRNKKNITCIPHLIWSYVRT